MLIPTALTAACRREPVDAPPPSVELARAPITDLAAVAGQDGPDLAGRPVQIAAAPVQRVVSNRLFWIGPGARDQQVLVVLTGEQPPPQVGQPVNVVGTVERVPSAPEGLRPLSLASQDEDLLRIQVVYIRASGSSAAVQPE